MKKSSHCAILLIGLLSIFFRMQVSAQADSLPKPVRDKVILIFRNFSVGFYTDAYYQWPALRHDTANIIPYSSNCPFANEIRLNVASMTVRYNAEKARGIIAVQYGDAPMLLTKPEEQFIKYLRQANFGFKVFKGLWVDFGYMLDPVGVESSWPVINNLSTVSLGGYYQPGSILGVKVSYQFSDRYLLAGYLCNPYSLAEGKNTNFSGALMFNGQPAKSFTFTYSFITGNQAPSNEHVVRYQWYNNLILLYEPWNWLHLRGQFDYAIQTHSKMVPHENETARMVSGFVDAKFIVIPLLSFTLRGEYFDDPQGFMSGVYKVRGGEYSGLKAVGGTAGFEVKPFSGAYLRLEYRYLKGNDGGTMFYGNQDHQPTWTFTTGLQI